MKPRLLIRRTTYLIFFCFAALIGLGAAHTNQPYQFGLVLLAGCLMLAARHQTFGLLLAVCLFGLGIGWWRGLQVYQSLLQYDRLDGQKVVMQLRADSEATYAQRSQLGFDGADIELYEPYHSQLPGKIGVSGFGEQAIYRGDKVIVEGTLRKGRGSKQAYLSYATLRVSGRDTSRLESMRRQFLTGLQNALPEPLASFAGGLLIGQRSTLPIEINRQLAAVGLTHIIAVSGYNLTIIIRAVRRYMRRLSKYQSTIISFALIGLFLLVTGFSASIVRAAIVSGLSLLAWYYGRTFRPLLLLVLTALITAYWNPLYLWSDIGWYLSFLAFYGVLILAPLLKRRLFTKHEPRLLGMVALESFSAQLLTAPFILWIFHQSSLVAPLSNLLIVPLVPLAMLLSLVAGLAGMFVPFMAGWLAWPARLLLTYMLDAVTLFARVPHALINRSLPLPNMLVLYGSIIAVISVLQTKLRRKHGIITETETII